MEKTLMAESEGKTQKQQVEDQDHGEKEDELVVKEGEIILRLFDRHPPDGTGRPFVEIAVPRQGLVSRIPYFATLFSEPWNASSSTSNKNIAPASLVERPNRPPVVELVCSPLSSCKAYYRFFELLKSAMVDGHIQPFPRGMLGSTSEAVELLPVADHLLFQECIDVCLQYLTRRPWSVEDEALIRSTLLPCFSSNITAAIKTDLQARLDSGSNMDIVFVRTCIFLLSPMKACLYPPEFFRTCLTSGRSKPGIQSLLMRIWVDETPRLCKEILARGVDKTPRLFKEILARGRNASIPQAWTDPIPQAWTDLTLSLLEYHPDALTLVKGFAEKPYILHMYSNFDNPGILEGLLIQIFKHARSGNISLSNSECLALLKMWDGQVQRYKTDHALFEAFMDVFKTLPLNDKAVFDFACMDTRRFDYLSSQLFSYIKRPDTFVIDTTNAREGKCDV